VGHADRETGGRRVYDAEAVDQVGVILFLADVGFTIAEIRDLLESRAESPHAWRRLVERKLEELTEHIASAEVAKVALTHALHCPEDDLLACPNFWAVVGRRLATGAVS
jgi:DNA-binding transcriptional MerR regulator